MILSLGATFWQSVGPNGATLTPFKPILMVFEGLGTVKMKPSWLRMEPSCAKFSEEKPKMGQDEAKIGQHRAKLGQHRPT